MSAAIDQLIMDLDKYFEMGNMMSALTVIANFISQERNNRVLRIRRQLSLFMTGVEENREEIKGVFKKWKKDSPSKIEELIDVLEGLEEMEDEEREELRVKLQAVAQEVVA
jgi:dsDNA-binding SOS-regulon protein